MLDNASILVTGGTGSFGSNVRIYGDLTVLGTETIINTQNLAIADNMIYLNSGSTITNPDLGFAGNYNDGTYAHLGLFADASDNNTFKVYKVAHTHNNNQTGGNGRYCGPDPAR